MLSKRLIIILSIIPLLLLIPLIAIQLTEEVKWQISDFVIGGIMLFVAALLVELLLRQFSISKFRGILVLVILLLLILTWLEMAVGIFGTPIAGS